MTVLTTTESMDAIATCDREPIHRLGKIQEHGYLLAFSSDMVVTHVSENCSDLFDQGPEDLLGKSAMDVLGKQVVHDIRNKLQSLTGESGNEILPNITLEAAETETKFDATISLTQDKTIVELEPSENIDEVTQQISEVQQAITRMARAGSVEKMVQFAVRYLYAATGYDRVMGYRFLPDGSGEVVSEAASATLEPYLGMRYPATDIPKQARDLYVRNPVRTIGDSHSLGVDIISNDEADTLDLSDSVLRSVSPIHLEYLRNMGVEASMSVSIILNGKLWGLLACHHGEPKVLPQYKRNSMALFGQMLSLLIAKTIAENDQKFQDEANKIIGNVSANASTAADTLNIFASDQTELMELFSADGMAVVAEGNVKLVGATPQESAVLALAEFLTDLPTDEILATNNLGSLHEAAEDYEDVASGMLALPISSPKRNFLMFFRGALNQKVTWAGNPEKSHEIEEDTQRISPRKSFQAWETIVAGQSDEWSESQVKAAKSLKLTVLEVVLKMTEFASEARKEANATQEILVAELNHRVRNILNLVRSLIAQTSKPHQSTADFVDVLENRIQAMARAHDQITKVNWSPASLLSLIHAEADAYISDLDKRLLLDGDDVLITPTAYSTLALVLHEILTNSVKHGALSSTNGKVSIRLRDTGKGSLNLYWEERDGPPVVEPTRRGFGFGIIQRSIPFELGGEAEVMFHPAGFRAKFVVPKEHLSGSSGKRIIKPTEQIETEKLGNDVCPSNVLLLEDNLLIAIDVEDMLKQIGAKEVVMLSTVGAALEALEKNEFDFALLDINLGTSTSIEVAEKALEKDVPFIFASGYGNTDTLPEHLKDCPILMKPYSLESMKQIISRALK